MEDEEAEEQEGARFLSFFLFLSLWLTEKAATCWIEPLILSLSYFFHPCIKLFVSALTHSLTYTLH